jgi:hypothetical protein
MKAFLRKNLMIVVSIALPLLVALLFALASVLPSLYSNPPAHDLLLSLHGRSTARSSQVRISLEVNDGQVKVMAKKSEKDANYQNNPRLFRYSHLSGEVREINIPIPENMAMGERGSEVRVAELASLRVSDALRAPDGYEFRGRRRGGGLITELFGGSRNRTDVSIANNGAVVRLRLPASDYWYNDVRFVGWVIE